MDQRLESNIGIAGVAGAPGYVAKTLGPTWLATSTLADQPPYRCNSYVGGPVRSVLTVNACDGIKRPTAISHITTLHRTHDGLIVGPPQISHMLISTGAFSASFKDSKELSVSAFANAARTL